MRIIMSFFGFSKEIKKIWKAIDKIKERQKAVIEDEIDGI